MIRIIENIDLMYKQINLTLVNIKNIGVIFEVDILMCLIIYIHLVEDQTFEVYI